VNYVTEILVINIPSFGYFEPEFRANFRGEHKMAANTEEAEYTTELHINSENLPETV
jgi:hypothetical protein